MAEGSKFRPCIVCGETEKINEYCQLRGFIYARCIHKFQVGFGPPHFFVGADFHLAVRVPDALTGLAGGAFAFYQKVVGGQVVLHVNYHFGLTPFSLVLILYRIMALMGLHIKLVKKAPCCANMYHLICHRKNNLEALTPD